MPASVTTWRTSWTRRWRATTSPTRGSFFTRWRIPAPVAERTLHIGDLYHADVVGARGAGVHALLLDPYDDWGAVDCPVAHHLTEVADVMAAARR